MAQIHMKEKTTVETSYGHPCEDCIKVSKDAKGLTRADDNGDNGCAGEFTMATAYINAPAYQNMLIIPSATSLNDAVNKASRCGGGPPVNFYSNAVLACAPYIRCPL
jgi:hypothetical protein